MIPEEIGTRYVPVCTPEALEHVGFLRAIVASAHGHGRHDVGESQERVHGRHGVPDVGEGIGH